MAEASMDAEFLREKVGAPLSQAVAAACNAGASNKIDYIVDWLLMVVAVSSNSAPGLYCWPSVLLYICTCCCWQVLHARVARRLRAVRSLRYLCCLWCDLLCLRPGVYPGD
jgi:hypothetical protein